MATNLTDKPLDLYLADEPYNVVKRQNGKYTHSFTVPIAHVGTALILIRSDSYFTEQELANKIKAGNNINDRYPFDLVYYQLLASCSLSDTIYGDTKNYTGKLSVSYRTTITAPAGKIIPDTELFAANTLLSRASRQASRTAEAIQSEIIQVDASEKTQFVYLVLVAAKEDGEEDTPYIFHNDGDEEMIVSNKEASESTEIADFLNTLDDGKEITLVRVLGFFPKDQPDFHKFMRDEYTIRVIGNCTLAIAESTNS